MGYHPVRESFCDTDVLAMAHFLTMYSFLATGCDCLGHIHYFDATLNNVAGEPYVKKKVVCMHEEDDGEYHAVGFVMTSVCLMLGCVLLFGL